MIANDPRMLSMKQFHVCDYMSACGSFQDRGWRQQRLHWEHGPCSSAQMTVVCAALIADLLLSVESVDNESDGSRKRRVMDAPRAQNLYHLEYSLVPDDPEQTIRTDLVSFGIAAKIFTEKQEAKVIKTWVENDQTWVAWTHW